MHSHKPAAAPAVATLKAATAVAVVLMLLNPRSSCKRVTAAVLHVSGDCLTCLRVNSNSSTLTSNRSNSSRSRRALIRIQFIPH